MTSDIEVDVAGRRLRLSNLDKILYPETGFTKGEVIRYYTLVAPVLLPHLRDRPLTLKRYPDGVTGEYFYEKECPAYHPDWLATAPIPGNAGSRTINYCLINELAALIWAANLADLELHTSLSLHDRIEQPTMLVFDLDPGAPAGITECANVALWLHELFDTLSLDAFAKTSGSKGLQVYIPLNTPVHYRETKSFARAVAELLEKQHPREVVSNMNKSLRVGKVFIDWSQNDEHKTTVCVYSLRARPTPAVSTPVTWEEVKVAAEAPRLSRLAFDQGAVLARIERFEDLFAPVLTLRQHLPMLG